MQYLRKPDHASRLGLFISLAFLLLIPSGTPALGQVDYEQPPISYLTAPTTGPVSKLLERIKSGEVELEHTPEHGYLHAVLEELDVPISSQVLVFSKTSLQRERISPRTPRALYFNDDVYVGWVPNGDVVEISSVDPHQGPIFYALKQRAAQPLPVARENDRCLQCHSSSMTKGVPGHLVRSVYTDERGMPVFQAGTFRTDTTSPLHERWGGWYVTGTHGRQRHMGNVTVANEEEAEKLDTEQGANVTDLSSYFATSRYLSPHSDIVALMVLEHQVAMHNCLTAANFEGRLAAHQCHIMNEALERPEDYVSESTERRYQSAAEKVVDLLLFVGEVQLSDPIQGTSGFAEEFTQRGPVDSQGRSLREFDLQQRIFRYPCSYLIYSAAFDNLPAPILDRTYRKLWNVLTGADSDERFQHLSPEVRQAILEILRDTKRELPEYWRQSSAS